MGAQVCVSREPQSIPTLRGVSIKLFNDMMDLVVDPARFNFTNCVMM